MPDSENGTEDQRPTPEEVLQEAFKLYSQNPAPDWVKFFRKILGLQGIVRRAFRTPEELEEFEQSEEYAEIQQMLSKLRERRVPPEEANEPVRVITVRLPKSLHESLRLEAHEHQTSMNKLCISKLLQFIDNQLVPRERWKRVAEGGAQSPPATEGAAAEEGAESDQPAMKEGAGADL